MALVDLLNSTNLKSLKFGHDRAEGGSSNQPYIETPINIKLPNLGFLSTDFLIRGGIPGAPLAAVNDVIRLGKYFTDTKSPNGLLFIAKQLVLSRIAVQTQASGLLLNGGIYTPLSTLGQAGLGFLGTHLNKQGLNPIPNSFLSLPTYQDALHPNLLDLPFNILKKINPGTSYANIINISLNKPNTDNRLIRIYDEKYKKELFGGKENVYKYGGGPGSVLGIGFTRIRFATDRATGDSLRTGVNGNNNKLFLNGPNNTWNFYTSNYNNSTIDVRDNVKKNNGDDFSFVPPIGITQILEDYSFIGLDKISLDSSKYTSDRYNINHYSYDKSKAGPPRVGSGVKFRNTQLLTQKYGRSEDNSPTSPLSLGSSIQSLNTYNNEFTLTGTETFAGVYFSTKNKGEIKPLFNEVGFVTSRFENYEPILKRKYVNNFSNLKKVDLEETYYTQVDIQDILTQDLFRYSNTFQDFRQKIRTNAEAAYNTAEDSYKRQFDLIIPYISGDGYNTSKMSQRINIGDQGNGFTKNLRKFTVGSVGTTLNGQTGAASAESIDKIAVQKLYSSKDDQFLNVLKGQNDLVNFRITSINNSNPSEEIYMHFRAFLGSISDNYSANWNSQKYVGRGENFYTYDGFDRKISLSFTLVAQSRVELIPMYTKLNYLISQMAPDYSRAGLMRGPLVTLTIGGYICDQPGFITGLNIEMGEDTTWEIGIDEDGNTTTMPGYDGYENVNPQLAHVIKVNGFSFTPIHKFAVKKADWKNLGATPYILNCGEPKPKKEEIVPAKKSDPVVKEEKFTNQFKWNSTEFEANSTSKQQLDKFILELKKSNATIEIEANASSEGSDALNLSLTKRRAEAIKNYIVSAGIDPSRIKKVEGLGEANANQSKVDPIDRNFVIRYR